MGHIWFVVFGRDSVKSDALENYALMIRKFDQPIHPEIVICWIRRSESEIRSSPYCGQFKVSQLDAELRRSTAFEEQTEVGSFEF
jgi:hypothetical protein